MIRHLFALSILILFSLPTFAQTTPTHIPASTSLVGIWRQTGATNTVTGKLVDVISGNYKVINPDGTFYTFVTWGIQNPSRETTIGQYGTYEITSDSTLVEHIIMHIMNPDLNGKDSGIRFHHIDENTMMMAWSLNNKIWVDERWSRLPLSMNK